MELNEVLRQNPLTALLSDDDHAALAASLVPSMHPDGHVFIREGKRGDRLFLLLEGEVLVTRKRSGAQLIKRLQPGELFGLSALVDNEPRSATCSAAGPVRVASLPQGAFSLLFNAHAPIADALLQAFAAQLASDFRNVNEQIREELARAPSEPKT